MNVSLPSVLGSNATGKNFSTLTSSVITVMLSQSSANLLALSIIAVRNLIVNYACCLGHVIGRV